MVAAQPPTFRSAVQSVRVDVLALSGNAPIAGLTAADFTLFDNGVPQQVESVLADTEPLDVLLVFDQSASTGGVLLARLKDAATAMLAQLSGRDTAALLTFNHRLTLAAPPGSTPDRVREAVRQIDAHGSTALVDAAAAALVLTGASQRRSLVLLFTDGADTLSWLTEDGVLESAKRSAAVVYAVTVTERSDIAGRTLSDARFLRRLTSATGGQLLRADQPTSLRETFARVLAEMRARYLLSFSPTAPAGPGWHTLTVRLRRPGRVVARPGYMMPASSY